MVPDWKSSLEYVVTGRVLHGSILGTRFFLLCINDISDNVICKFAIFDYDQAT